MYKVGAILSVELLYQYLDWLSKIVNYTQFLYLVTKYSVEPGTFVIRSRISNHVAAMFYINKVRSEN
jgi:hypothetical protein